MNFSNLTIAALLFAGSLGAVPGDLGASYESLQKAVAAKDAAKVKQLATETSGLASEIIASPAPSDADDKDAWTKRVAWAKDVHVYSEYALYATAIQSPPATLVDLIGTLEKVNPKSKYLQDAYGPYFVALNQTGAAAKIPAIAEKAVANIPDNEDALLVMADSSLTRKQSAQAQTYANRLVAAMNKHAKPEAMSAAD